VEPETVEPEPASLQEELRQARQRRVAARLVASPI
jgi:hypothetical protein